MLIHDADEPWAVLVQAPEHQCGEICQQAEDAISRIMGKLEGVFYFGKTMFDDDYVKAGEDPQPVYKRFNLTVANENGQEGVAVPSIVVFLPGPRHEKPSEVVLSQQVVLQLVKQGPKSFVAQLKQFLPHATTSVSTSTLAGFLTPKDPRPRRRALVVSSKASLALQARKLSLDVLAQADTGVIRTSNAAVFDMLTGVEAGQPGVYLSEEGTLPALGTAEKDVDPSRVRWKRYAGSRAFMGMNNWTKAELGRPVAPSIRSQAEFEQACEHPGGICVIAVVPPASENPGPSDAARSLAGRQFFILDIPSFTRGDPRAEPLPVRVFKIDARAQASWAAAFGATAPTLVALNARSKRFVTFTGPYGPPTMHDFVMKVVSGSLPLEKADPWPRLVTEPTVRSMKRKTKTKGGKPKKPKRTGDEL